MLTQLVNIPDGFTAEASLNGKYLKGIPTAVTNPDVDIGNATHTHASDGDHTHDGTVASHTHSGTSSNGPTSPADNTGTATPFGHNHGVSSDSQAEAEASSDGAHTHDAFTNDLEHRTITFYKNTDTTGTHMSKKSLPRDVSFFYSKTGTLDGLAALTDYIGKHIKGNATPGTDAGSNLHQHDNQAHNHPVDIGAHEHVLSFGGTGSSSPVGGSAQFQVASAGHSHPSGSAATTGKSSTPVTSGNSSGHQHDDITHEPAFKTLQLLQVNSLKMSNVGVPKNCILLWLDLVSLIVAGWQVSDGTNETIDMLDIYPKGSATPDTTGGSDTHTHSTDSVTHSHTGGSVGHSHSTTGSSAAESSTFTGGGIGVNAARSHTHTPGTVSTQAAQTITVTNAASNHDHGAQNSEPEAKTVAFIERST